MAVSDSTMEETRWITAAQRGDRDAFCELVRLYRTRVVDVVYRMCGDPCLAEDAAQNAFLNAWQRLGDFHPGTSFRNWLFRIAANAALDMLRRERPGADIDNLELPFSGEAVETRVQRQEQARQVRRAVLTLPEASRVVLVLREYQGLSYQEIAETLEISIGTVMSRLNYARTKLVSLLARELEEA